MKPETDNLKRRVRVEIDLGALVRNYRRIAAHVRPADVLCVLKANAYGLGVAPYAKALAQAGCTRFGVAEPFEALELQKLFGKKKGGPRVQILSSVLPDEIDAMVRAGVTLPVVDTESARLVSAAAVRREGLVVRVACMRRALPSMASSASASRRRR